MENSHDIAIIGGGIVGLATARALGERAPGARLVILEKEARLATHQTGNNSGVIHSGIYYKPGSYKAKLCVEGKGLMLEFCQKHGIRVDHVGKVIVATEPAELPRLQTLYERGIANGVPVEMIEPAQLWEIEPHASALRAIRSPSTAIVDYKEVCSAMTRELTARGVTIETNARVTSIKRTADAIDLETPRAVVRARRIVNCAGLYSDVLARMAGARVNLKIIPFRGEYYMIRPERQDIVRGLIYPVPDPEFPFLGVHLTRTVHGEVEAGPNAVLAFAREGYTFGRVSPGELAGTLAYSGFWNMTRRYWRMGTYEMYRSLSKGAFVQALQRLSAHPLSPASTPRGADGTAPAVSPHGSVVGDFRLIAEADAGHVLHAPPPGAAPSIAIGRPISERGAAARSEGRA